MGWVYWWFKAILRRYKTPPSLKILYLSPCTYYSGRIPCVILLEWTSPNCQELETKWKIQNENICIRRESNQRLAFFKPGALDRLITGTYIMMRLKLLQNHGIGISTRDHVHATITLSNLLWLYVYWNRMSDKIFISFTTLDFSWTRQTIIKLINDALSCVHVIHMQVFCKSLNENTTSSKGHMI